MRVSDRLRDRATRLRALASEAREDGKPPLADRDHEGGVKLSNQADAMDRGDGHGE
jgi:hypothetical protein